MALPTLDSVFASASDLPRRQMLAKWLVEETETGGNSSVAVSGAGSSAANGTYTYRGDNEGKPYYNLVGEADSTTENEIVWDSVVWSIQNLSYESSEDVEFPWLVTSWAISNGESPVPTVTEIPPQSPTIADYWTLPERYLWAKIAVAAGGPLPEANYISLPKNYVWSDIYNAVAGLIPPSNILVSGLQGGGGPYIPDGPSGVYTYAGMENGKPKYEYVAQNEDPSLPSGTFVLQWDTQYLSGETPVTAWYIFSPTTDIIAKAEEDTVYPWQSTLWEVYDAGSGSLVIAESLAPSPNHTDWSEKQALGHIAAAYRGDTGNPANLATYIDWPWRYQVASIITSL